MSGSANRALAWAGVALVVMVLCLAEFAVGQGAWSGLDAGPVGNLPVMALLMVVALIVLPPLVWRGIADGPEPDPALAIMGRTISAGRSRVVVLLGLAILATAAGLIVLAGTLPLPSSAGQVTLLDLTRPVRPVAGKVTVTGAHPGAGELRYHRDRFGFSPDTRFLPIVDTAHRGAPWLVVQLPDDGLTFDPRTLPGAGFSGLLVADGLPASAQSSLRHSGQLVQSHYWTLYTRPLELYRPYWLRAGARLLTALLLLAFAGLAWRQVRILERHAEKLRERDAMGA